MNFQTLMSASGMQFVELSLQFRDQGGDATRIFDVHQQLTVAAVGVFRAVGEHEPKSALADEARDMSDAGLASDVRLDLRQLIGGHANVRALRERQVDHELRSGRLRHEPGGYEAEAERGRDQQGQQREAANQATPQQPMQQRPVAAQQRMQRSLSLERHDGKEPDAEQWGERHREQPAEQHGIQDHPEQRAGVLAHLGGRQSNGTEGQNADRGAAQQRPLGRLHDGHGGTAGILAPLQPHENAVSDDDRIVDQHAERDDQRAERDALHGDAVEVHGDHRPGHGQQQDHADDEPAAHAHEYHEYQHHDRHGRNQVGDKAAHGDPDRVGLVGNDLELHPHRAL
jgi:hypothetical protein